MEMASRKVLYVGGILEGKVGEELGRILGGR